MASELFPETVELEVTTEDGLEALEGLAEPITEEENSAWLFRSFQG